VRSDLELLEAWRAGDRIAGNELLARHFQSLYRFFASKVPNEAEDLIQSTLLACVTYIERVAEASSFRAYLFTIATNQLYAHLRKHARVEGQVDFTLTSMAELGISPSSVVAQREREQQVSMALRRLPLELQVVLELGYWEELSASETATVLGLPLGTAKSKIRRAKQLLRAELDPLGPEPGSEPGSGSGMVDELGEWVRSVQPEKKLPGA
jgi:RNA polymerase sigma-70 factor (ECF subfamily)